MSKKLKLWEGEVGFVKDYYSSTLDYRLETYQGYQSNANIKLNNCIFYGEFKFIGFERGRSSATALYHSLDESLGVEMFLNDLGEVIKEGFQPNPLQGYFCFQKRGANYGIKYLGTEIPESNLEVGELKLESFEKERDEK